ncbi:MAG: hypothetical protein LUO93_02390 [Methanomicrobiales archaeon]|nr:hypothetical protein [Methanomicrobiales archaeon]
MKAYEVGWEAPFNDIYVSSWDTNIEAAQETDRLNNRYNGGFYIKRNPDGEGS